MASDFKQRDAARPLRVFELEPRQIGIERRHLPVDIFLGLEPAVAAIGVDAEIADQKRRQHVKRERVEDRAEPFAGDHAATMRGGRLKRH